MVGKPWYGDGEASSSVLYIELLMGSTCVKEFLFKGIAPFSFVASHTNVLGTHFVRTHFFGHKDPGLRFNFCPSKSTYSVVW